MALPLEEQVALAEALWQRISEGLEAGGRKEAMQQALQRVAELDSGSAVSRSHDEVMQSARRAMAN